MLEKLQMILLSVRIPCKILSLALVVVVAGSSITGAAELSAMFCDYSAYLEEPVPRARFMDMRNEMHQKAQTRASEDSRYRSAVMPTSGTPEERVDEVSAGCLGCHDEMGAMVKNGSAYQKGMHNQGMARMASSHSIGMDYESRVLHRNDLKSSISFPENMVLVDGKMGCVTCHDPLNRENNHLATSSNRSSICFACHNI